MKLLAQATASIVIAASLSACSVFQKPAYITADNTRNLAATHTTARPAPEVKKRAATEQKVQSQTNVQPQAKVQAQAKKEPASAIKAVKTDERKASAVARTPKPAAHGRPNRQNDTRRHTPIESGEWFVTEVAGKAVTGDTRPYLGFDAKTLTFYGDNGCNVVNGRYTADAADGSIKFSDIAVSLSLCPGVDHDYIINNALERICSYEIADPDNSPQLILKGSAGNVLMRLSHHVISKLDGEWRVTRINNRKFDRGTDYILSFDLRQRTVYGRGPCNVINGELVMNPDEANALQIENIHTTRAQCDDLPIETALLVALEETARVEFSKNGHAILISLANEHLMELEPIKIER